MRKVIGTVIAILSVTLGLYVGIWVMFVGGIIQLIEAIKAAPVSSYGIAVGIVKIVFASFVGYIVAYIGIIVGAVIGGAPLRKSRFIRK